MFHHSLFQAPRFLRAIFAALALVLLAGCDLKTTDLTPRALPENPSRIYTFSVNITPKNTNVVVDSIRADLVIDGQTLEMRRGALGSTVFEYDYQLPAGRDEVAYYYHIRYNVENKAGIVRRETFTDVFRARVVGRYVLTLETNRGPVGSRISVVGRGFNSSDVIKFDGQPVMSFYESPNAMSFIVPAVETGRNYRVTLEGPAGSSPIGTFRVDPSTLSVNPLNLRLRPGSSQLLTFTVPSPAPTGGLFLDVTTDIPESVIMPEVIVPAGMSVVSVEVRGGKPGRGALYLKGYGPSGEIVIPVTVE